MDPERYFRHPTTAAHRQYEILRASFLERLPARIVAERFGVSAGYVHLLRHQFRKGELTFLFGEEPRPGRKTLGKGVRARIVELRELQLNAGEIAEMLDQEGVEVSVRTVERALAREGYPKLPRRTQLKIGLTRAKTVVPDRSQQLDLGAMEPQTFTSDSAGIWMFAPLIEHLRVPEIAHKADLPQSASISSWSYLLSLLALKLMGEERVSHVTKHSFDAGAGLFAGLNVLPKTTALSTYSYSIDSRHMEVLQQELVRQARRLGLYREDAVNLDFHTVQHYGEESVLENHWSGTRNKTVKSALTLFAQDAGSGLILYSDADIRRAEQDEQVFEFVRFWKKVRRRRPPTLVFDSRFTIYPNLDKLNQQDIRFITLRRRGSRLVEWAKNTASSEWTTINIPHAKRKHPNLRAHDSLVDLRGYSKKIRQIVLRDTGHEKPTFLITNDLAAETETVVSQYALRWGVENRIAELVKFFHLNALSSPILIKVHLDVTLTAVADTLYWMLAQRLRGFEACDAPKIYRDFVKGHGTITVTADEVRVVFPKRAHNPVLRAAPWHRLPARISWLGGRTLSLIWQ